MLLSSLLVITFSICTVERNIQCLVQRFEVHVASVTLGENLQENMIFGSGILDDAAARSACKIICNFQTWTTIINLVYEVFIFLLNVAFQLCPLQIQIRILGLIVLHIRHKKHNV